MDQGVDTYLQLITQGDQQAFRELIKLFGVSMHHFAYSITGNKQEAEEVVSDVFIKTWQHRESLPAADFLRCYLFKAVKNTALNYIKRNDRLENCYSQWEMEVSRHPNYTPEDIAISNEHLRLIRDAINSLPPRCREIFLLVKEEGFSYAETATLLEISVATVNVQMTIAAKKIWGILDPILQISHS